MTRSKKHGHEPQMSRHHKIAKVRNGSNRAPNNEKIKHEVHQAIHLVFQNKHIIEKIDQLVTMDSEILTDQFKRAIMDVLAMSPQDTFKIEAFRSKNGYESLDSIIDNI